MVFLGRNTPTPLLSEYMSQVDDTIVEAVCRHGTRGGYVDWSPHLRKFVNMKIQVSHFRGDFGITPNEGSAISAFYSEFQTKLLHYFFLTNNKSNLHHCHLRACRLAG